MIILGLNAFHGDSSAALLIDGKLVAAAEEERFRRIKHWAGFPSESISFCLAAAGVSLSDVNIVAINTDPKAARFRKLNFALTGGASFSLIKEKLSVRKKRTSLEQHFLQSFPAQNLSANILYVEHHLAHLSSAYHVSPYERASVISVDGFGDFASTATGLGEAQNLSLEQRVYFPHSMGIFYQALTQYLGFPYYGDEYKIMGLAPYGEAKYQNEMDQIVGETDDGFFKLNLDFFCHHKKAIGYEWDNGSPQVSQLFTSVLEDLLGPARQSGEELTQFHRDVARSVQDKYERTFFHMLNKLHHKHQTENVCVAGGCGMNSVANGKIHLRSPFKNIYVQSAAGDAGGAIGAALIANQQSTVSSTRFHMSHSYWGNEFSDAEIESCIEQNSSSLRGAKCHIERQLTLENLVNKTSDAIIAGKVIGWFQGGMEWGPRALGNRSILGDPRRNDMKDILNLKIKRRESFRPFAPSVLRSEVKNWFESDADVPFMMKVFQIKESKRAEIPAVTHVDGSGRLQTVDQETNPTYHALISKFFEKTAVPMLLNTSFNENEPVVCTPQQAMDCFLRTNMDVLVLGSNIIQRES